MSATRTRMYSWFAIDKAASPEYRKISYETYVRTFGPSGIFEQDDGENWSEVQAISHGFITNGVPLNYQMGMGSEREDGTYPGRTSELYSDAAGRSFYQRWKTLMNTPAWHESGLNGENDNQKEKSV